MPGHGDMCSMSMTFTWDWHNTCVVFKWWHVKTPFGLMLTLVLLVALAAGYEWARARCAVLDAAQGMSRGDAGPLLGTNPTDRRGRVLLAFRYGLLVGYSFMLMLVFMTYNGWYMLATVVGAGLGNYAWGTASARGLSCH